MKLAEEYLATLDAADDYKAYAAFTRLVSEPSAPVHNTDLRAIIEWLCTQLDSLSAQLAALQRRQDPEFHNPENGT